MDPLQLGKCFLHKVEGNKISFYMTLPALVYTYPGS